MKNKIESLFLGIIAAGGALVAEVFLITLFSIPGIIKPNQTQAIFSEIGTMSTILVVFVIIEEVFKYLMISSRVHRFSSNKNIIPNSLLVGAGFSILEIFLIYNNFSTYANPSSIDILQVFLVHTLTAGIMGGIIYKNENKSTAAIKSLLLTSIIHLFTSFMIITSNPYSYQINFTLLFFLLIVISVNIRLLKSEK